MKPALLDVNVLVAALDQNHVHHYRAAEWLGRNIAGGWATCAITQNGFARIVSQPSYPNPVSTAQAVTILRQATSDLDHHFWPCDIQLPDAESINLDYLLGPKQITDTYLLALAIARGGRFITFDQRVSPSAARNATPADLVVLSAQGA
ncbi:MAG: PIN domain-containing protein [Bifidobacteriaceae bacterium]|jgi:toxin-antitoxin system PIN domain toxin|nr:PIN domain-containing protein [Bifidobacteriaceae bacterium]